MANKVCTFVSHVVNLVKDNPSYLSGNLRATIKHAPQNLYNKR